MPSPIKQALNNLGERLDQDLLPYLYETASLTTTEVRGELGALVEFGKDHDLFTDSYALDLAADHVIKKAVRTATFRGAVAGAGGLVAIPPEIVAAAVQLLHLAQRLAVLYGHDPETDKGRVLLTQAMAKAFEVALPAQGRLGVRVKDLPQMVSTQLNPNQTEETRVAHRRNTVWMARTFATRIAVSLTSRFGRAIPGIGAAVGSMEARRRLKEQGERMKSFFQNASDVLDWGNDECEEAIEVHHS